MNRFFKATANQDMKAKRRFLIINALFVILISGLLYYLFCPEVLFVKTIDSLLPFDYTRTAFAFSGPILFIRGHLFDFLWSYAFADAILAYNPLSKKMRMFALSISAVVGTALELLQLSGAISGTFDPLDILFEILGALLAMLIYGGIYEKI